MFMTTSRRQPSDQDSERKRPCDTRQRVFADSVLGILEQGAHQFFDLVNLAVQKLAGFGEGHVGLCRRILRILRAAIFLEFRPERL
jgi:hypothetical protein